MEDSIKHIVKSTDQWNITANQYKIIERGCLCIELCPDGKTKIKVGEGNKFYGDLPYIGGDGGDLSNYYTKAEVNRLVNNLDRMKIASTFEYDSQFDLPLKDNSLGDVRFVKNPNPSVSTDPIEYLWNGRKWIYLGGMLLDVDLSEYVKRSEIMPVIESLKQEDVVIKRRVTALEDIGNFKGATETSDGEFGYVPPPSRGEQNKYLKGDGTWGTVDTTIPPATNTTIGGVIVGNGLRVDDTGKLDVVGGISGIIDITSTSPFSINKITTDGIEEIDTTITLDKLFFMGNNSPD